MAGVYGITSLIFWSLMIIVSIKYAGFIMRAHNRGDGGIMALTALIQRRKVTRGAALVVLGLLGAGLFFGDGMITPAISVTSAVEGLKVATPGLSHLVVPISLAILIGLFAVQRFGTGAVGWLFGPVMLIWFAIIGVLGAREVIMHPGVLQGLSPTWGVRFMLDHGVARLAGPRRGGAVRDRRRSPVRRPGPLRRRADSDDLVRRSCCPAVLLSYLGQSALILSNPKTISNPFFLLVPSAGRLPMVFLATGATIIASQAALTGSFSVAKQAVQLGFLPRLKIVHTSETEGQIYVPLINWGLCLGVAALVLVFQDSSKLADIYGVAVTGTFILDTTLFIAVARSQWHTAPLEADPPWSGRILTIEVAFFTSNLTKVTHGAWLPLLVGLVFATVMVTWRKGRDVVTHNRTEEEGPLDEFLDELCDAKPPIVRLPGTAIFLNPSKVHHPAGAPRPGRAQPRLPREGGHRLPGPGRDPACRRLRPVRLRAARHGPVQDRPRHHAGRLSRPARPPRAARARPASAASWTATSISSTPPTSSPA